jgi:N-acetylneuraminate lyase
MVYRHIMKNAHKSTGAEGGILSQMPYYRAMTTLNIRGIIPALVTPFDQNYKLNTGALPEIIEPMLQAGVAGLFITGSSGEVMTLTVDERKAVAEAVLKAVRGRVPVIVHIGGVSAEEAIALSAHAKEIGAAAVSSFPPAGSNKFDETAAYYKAIAGGSDLPFIVYWRSDMAQGNITPKSFLEAMQELPTFAGIKFTDPNFHFLQRVAAESKDSLNIFSGPDELFLAGQVMGAHGAIGTTYNIMPNTFVGIYKDFLDGNIKQAMEKQLRAGELIQLLIEYGVIAGTKAIMTARGLPVGPARKNNPLTAHTEHESKSEIPKHQLDEMLAVCEKYNLN